LDGQIWKLKAYSLTSPLTVTVTVTMHPRDSAQSDQSAIITPLSPCEADTVDTDMISGFFDFGHLMTQTVMVCGK